MRSFFKTLGLWTARAAAVLVMVLALLVGVARLLLPEVPRFADDIRQAALDASGFMVDFELLSAGVSLYGPELRLAGATVQWPDGSPAFAADEISVAIDVYELLAARKWVPSLIHVDGLQVDIEISPDGEIHLQGRPWSDYVGNQDQRTLLTEVRLSLEDIRVTFRDLKRGIDEVDAEVRQLIAVLDDDIVDVEADIRPDPGLSRRLELIGSIPLQLFRDAGQLADTQYWRLQLRAEDFRLDRWLKLAAITNAPVIDSEGTAEASVEFRGKRPVRVEATADIDQLILAQPEGEPVVYDKLAGNGLWQRQADGWLAEGSEISVIRDGRRWPATEFAARYSETPEQSTQLVANVAFVRLQDVMPFLEAFAGKQLAEAGVHGSFSGDVWRTEGEIELLAGKLRDYKFRTDFDNLGYQSLAREIDVAGLTGEIKGDQTGGSVLLATQDARLGWGYLFRESLPVDSLEGVALWRTGDETFRLIVSDLNVQTPDGGGTASLELVSDTEWRNPMIDLTAEASMEDATQAVRYLPNMLPLQVINWVEDAVLGGRSDKTEFRLKGPLRKFPFRDDQGSFYIDIEFKDASLRYGPGWPVVEDASGHLIFDNESMYSTDNLLTIAGMNFENVNARISDLRQPVVEIAARGPARAENMVAFLQNSPVAKKLGGVFADVRAEGQTDVDISLQIPVRDLENWQLQGTVKVRDVSAWLISLTPRFSKLSGDLSIDRFYVTADELNGMLLDEPVVVQIESNSAADANFSHRASVSGSFPYSRLRTELALPDLGVVDGRSRFKASAMFPAIRAGSEPFRLLVHSDLDGIASSLPYPLNKNAAGEEDFDAEVLFPDPNLISVRLALERGLRAELDIRRAQRRWGLAGGLVEMGTVVKREPGTETLVVTAAVDRLDMEEWRTAFTGASTAGSSEQNSQNQGTAQSSGRRWQDFFQSAELLIGDLRILGFSFEDTDVRANFGGSKWDVELIGPWLEGRITVPYEIDSDAIITAELARLYLIEPVAADMTSDSDEYAVTPLNMPGFRGTADDFALGSMRLGRLDIEVASTGNGLETRQLKLTAPSFDATLSGDWQMVGNAQRSRVHVEFYSSDVQKSLERLGFAPLISARSGTLISDLLWEGAPGMAALQESTGELKMSIRDGHINEVSSGGGRILGLLSVASLPRRLALDFTDLTRDQLEFSKIEGDFSIDFGDAWTCNLAMEGEVADMALVGRTGLNAQDYNQVAVVRPHVSNLMPVPAAFLGGPTVGVAALLVSQIFKKPLSGIGESYYTIRGSWENSAIEKVQRSQLDTAALGDCEQRLPTLSPEEIAAIRDLLNPPNNTAEPTEATSTEATGTENTETTTE